MIRTWAAQVLGIPPAHCLETVLSRLRFQWRFSPGHLEFRHHDNLETQCHVEAELWPPLSSCLLCGWIYSPIQEINAGARSMPGTGAWGSLANRTENNLWVHEGCIPMRGGVIKCCCPQRCFLWKCLLDPGELGTPCLLLPRVSGWFPVSAPWPGEISAFCSPEF